MDINKKRFSCSGCSFEAVTKHKVEVHIKSKTLHKNIIIPLYVIDTPNMQCQYCYVTVKTMTRKNHMEEHLKICVAKNNVDMNNNAQPIQLAQNIQNINIQNNVQINYTNIIINPYDQPSTNHLVYDENLVKNRIALFNQIYLNNKVPENHSLVYDPILGKIKVYSNNNKYDLVDVGKLFIKVSGPLDRIQGELIQDNVVDPELSKKINDFIDLTYSEYETKNKSRYGQIVMDCKRITAKTWDNIEKIKKEQKDEENKKVKIQVVQDKTEQIQDTR